MRKFMVNVNGTSYEVMVEEIGGAGAPAGRAPAPRAPRAPVSRPAPAPAPIARPIAPAPAPAPAAPAPAPAPAAGPVDGTAITSPMPGNILDVKVKVGDTIKAGDVVVILEAMKMENEITSSVGGTVKSVNVQKGGAAITGQVLVVIG